MSSPFSLWYDWILQRCFVKICFITQLVSHWSDSKSSSVSRTLLSILINLNNAVDVMDFPCSIYSQVLNPFSILWELSQVHQPLLESVSSSISLFFSSLAKVWYLSLFSISCFHSVNCWDSKLHYSAGSLFLLTITRSCHLTKIRWSVCIAIIILIILLPTSFS